MEDSSNVEAKAGQGPEERNGLATDNCSPFILADWFFLFVLLKGGLAVHPDWTADTNNTKLESNLSQRTETEQVHQIYDECFPIYQYVLLNYNNSNIFHLICWD